MSTQQRATEVLFKEVSYDKQGKRYVSLRNALTGERVDVNAGWHTHLRKLLK